MPESTIAVAMSGGVDSSVVAGLLHRARRARRRPHHAALESAPPAGARARRRPTGRCCSLDDVYDARHVAQHPGHSVLRRELRGALRRAGGEAVRRRISGGPHADPLHALQQLHQVRSVSRNGRWRRRGTHRHRPLRADRLERRQRPLGDAPQRGSRQGSDLFSVRPEAGSTCAHHVSAGRDGESRRCASWRASWAFPPPRSPTARKSASFPTAITRLHRRLFRGAGNCPPKTRKARWSPPTAASSASTRGVHHFTVGQRRGLGVAAGEPLYVIATEPATQRVVIGRNDDLLRGDDDREAMSTGFRLRAPRSPLRAKLRFAISIRPPRRPSRPPPIPRASKCASTSRSAPSLPARARILCRRSGARRRLDRVSTSRILGAPQICAGTLVWVPALCVGFTQTCSIWRVPRLRRIALKNLEMAGFADARAHRRRRVPLHRPPAGRPSRASRDDAAKTLPAGFVTKGWRTFRTRCAAGRGVLVATAHLGNWELSAFAHAWMTAPMHIVVRPLDNPRSTPWSSAAARFPESHHPKEGRRPRHSAGAGSGRSGGHSDRSEHHARSRRVHRFLRQ